MPTRSDNPAVRTEDDPIIQALVPDPAAVPDLQVLAGYSGRSSRPKHIRLYYSSELNGYCEIPAADVVHRVSLRTGNDPLGRTIVWVRRESKLVRVSAQTRQQHADWLVGTMTAAVFGGGAAPFLGPLTLTARSDIGPSWCPACTAVPTVAMADTGPVLVNPQPWTQPWSTCDSNCV